MLGCACHNVRRASRTLTHHYDQHLAPVDIKATQFPILVALKVVRSIPLGPLADALLMDRTTLTRHLRLLEQRGAVLVSKGKDRRVRMLSLTPEGGALLEEALKLWKVAQDTVKDRFGPQRLGSLLDELFHLTSTVRS